MTFAPDFDGGGKPSGSGRSGADGTLLTDADVFGDEAVMVGRPAGQPSPTNAAQAGDRGGSFTQTLLDAVSGAPAAMQRSLAAALGVGVPPGVAQQQQQQQPPSGGRESRRVMVLTPEEGDAMGMGLLDPTQGMNTLGGGGPGVGTPQQQGQQQPTQPAPGATGEATTTPTGQDVLPPNPTNQSTLKEVVRRLAEEQAEEEAVVADLTIQGSTRPTEVESVLEHLASVTEPVVLLAFGDGPFVLPIHSVFQWKASGRSNDIYDGEYFGAVGDRDGDDDPPFVKLSKSLFEWKQVKLLTSEGGEQEAIDAFYGDPTNRRAFFPTTGRSFATPEPWTPRMPIAPYEVSNQVLVKKQVTAHELARIVETYTTDKSEAVQTIVEPLANFAKAATLKPSNSSNSAMACNFQPVTLPSKAMKARMAQRLNETLGPRPPKQPQGTPPIFPGTAAPLAHQVARETVAAMAIQRDGSDMYLKGVEHAMRLNHQTESDDVFSKRFSKVQRASIMGLCRERRWTDVPAIWKEIEGTKSEADLRKVLSKYWLEYRVDLNVQFYDMFWSDEMLKAIRTVDFVESDMATFLTSESGLSLLQLMPRTQQEKSEYLLQKKRLAQSKGTLTYADAKNLEKMPRLPPNTWESTYTLLTTWCIFLKMLFGGANGHVQGVDSVRGQLMQLGKLQHAVDATYYANVIWAVLDDACKHFSEYISMDDFKDPRACILWPQTNLHAFANTTMASGQPIHLMSFPAEWTDALMRQQGPSQQSGAFIGSGRGSGRGGGQSNQRNSGGVGGGGGGGRSSTDHTRTTAPSNRYGNAKNPRVPSQLKALLAPLGPRIETRRLFEAAGTGYMRLSRGKNDELRDNRPCPAYTCGYCPHRNCETEHLYDSELPSGYANWLVDELRPGVEKLREATTDGDRGGRGGGGRRKRDRDERDGGGDGNRS